MGKNALVKIPVVLSNTNIFKKLSINVQLALVKRVGKVVLG